MAEKMTAPSWLKINDENFRDLLEYLCRNAKSKDTDPFYAAARELLRDRVSSLLPVLADDLSGEEDEQVFRTRLLGAWLLCFPEKSEERMQVLFTMLNCLSQIVTEELAQKLFGLSVRIVSCGDVDVLGFSWDDLVDVKKEVLAYKIAANAILSKPTKRELWYDGKGLMHVTGDEISVMPLNRKRYTSEPSRMSDCMRIADDRFCVYVDKGEKLKQSDSSDIAKIEKFTSDFRRVQKDVIPTGNTVKRYVESQEVMVRVTGLSQNKVSVETVDPAYERISGYLYHPKGLFYYSDLDFCKALQVGDCMRAVIVNMEKGRFSIYKRFQDTLLEQVEVDLAYPAEFLQYHDKEGSLWMTNSGVPVYVKNQERYMTGDRAYLCITLAGGNGYVTAKIDDDQEGIEEAEFDDSKVWFIQNCILEDYVAPVIEKAGALTTDFVKLIERALYNYQKTLSRASEIYKNLCYCQILSELVGDERELHYLELKADYLEQLVFFTKCQYSDMKPLVPSSDIADMPSVIRSVKMVDVLKEIEADGDSELLTDTILSSDDELILRTAKILQSYNRVKDIVPDTSLNDLRTEIIRGLSLDADVQASLDDNDDEYLGMEDKVKEFKTSFVYPADKSQHMSPNLRMQSHGVFRAICAFLNSKVGGTLYLGVSDSGYVVGIDNDLDYLKCNLDGYIRLIQDESKKVFDKGVLNFLDFEVMFEGRVVAVKVRPFDDGVVCLDKVPYIRRYGESEPMREDERVRIISEKVVSALDNGSKLDSLENAISQKKRAVLRRFSSSERIEDRKVEPFKIVKGGKYVWAYDLEAKCCKQFGLSKMAAVDMLQDPWTHEAEHKEQQTDIFNWSGDKPMSIELELDLVAKNIIVDEYPLSEKFIKQTDREGKTWQIATDVYGCIAPGRFCIGLADHVTIVKGEELKEYVRAFVKKNFI